MSRVMWAPEGFAASHSPMWLAPVQDEHYPVRVRVEEIAEDEPDLSVGDRVTSPRATSPLEGELFRGGRTVAARPFRYRGQWWVTLEPGAKRVGFITRRCSTLTKLPPTVTRTIRVTGPEDAVEDYVRHQIGDVDGVTVEVDER